MISYREHWEGNGTLPCSIYAKLHMATALPDSSIQPVSDSQVQNDVAQSCKCGYILSNGGPGFFDVIVLCQIGFFILEAAKPALNHNVVCPAAVPINNGCQI